MFSELFSSACFSATRSAVLRRSAVEELGSTTVERKLHFDLLYIYNYSLLLDLKILFQTILVVLRREQADGMRLETASMTRRPAIGKIPNVEDAIEQATSSND